MVAHAWDLSTEESVAEELTVGGYRREAASKLQQQNDFPEKARRLQACSFPFMKSECLAAGRVSCVPSYMTAICSLTMLTRQPTPHQTPFPNENPRGQLCGKLYIENVKLCIKISNFLQTDLTVRNITVSMSANILTTHY